MTPHDEHNAELVANVHPADWQNPEPAAMYNLVVIGAGSAGLVCAAGAAGLGAKVALVESRFLGGDCLNFGCVPSKAFIRSSRVAAQINAAGQYGITIHGGAEVDFAAVMQRVRRLRADISEHDSAKRFSQLGVDVFLSEGHFSGPDCFDLQGKTLRFKKAVIATGSRPVKPPIEGLAKAGFVTNETVFSLTQRPEHMIFIGAGPIGCELAQAFRRLGCQVTIIEKAAQFLPREDPHAAELLADVFNREGIEILFNAKVVKVSIENNKKAVHVDTGGEKRVILGDQILLAVGRQANIEGLDLEKAGVQYDAHGIVVNDKLQTSNPRIYSAGDVCLKYKFTHMADAAARIVIQNALFPFFKKKLSSLTVPWCTYTDPEIAHVGMYEKQAAAQGIDIETFTRPLAQVDRAVVDGQDQGFIKIHVKKGTDRILGATIIASHAGDMISQITTAMVNNLGLKALSAVIHPYPTQAEAIKQAAEAYNRTRLTPRTKRLFQRWFAWLRYNVCCRS